MTWLRSLCAWASSVWMRLRKRSAYTASIPVIFGVANPSGRFPGRELARGAIRPNGDQSNLSRVGRSTALGTQPLDWETALMPVGDGSYVVVSPVPLRVRLIYHGAIPAVHTATGRTQNPPPRRRHLPGPAARRRGPGNGPHLGTYWHRTVTYMTS